jgi:ATP-binding protein involved in chromosome partitioning
MNKENIIKALQMVKDPWLNRDIVTLDFVQDLQLTNGNVRFKLILNRPSASAQTLLEQKARDALLGLNGVDSVEIITGWNVPAGNATEGKQSVPGVKNLIAVSSGKGGVGKSTVAVNLAVSLAQAGAKVGLLDTDVYGPNVPIMIGMHDQPSVHGQRLMPNVAHGLKVMSLGFLNPGDRPVVWRGPMLHTAIRQFLYDVEWGALDYLVVDMPPGTGDAQLSLAQLVPVQGAVLVTTPQEVAMADVRKAINMFDQVHIPVLGIVENMSYFVCDNCSTRHAIFGSGGGQELARRFNVPLLGQVPLSIEVREGGDAGVPIVIGDPESLQAAAFREIADNVATQITVQAMKGGGLPVINLSDNRGDSFAV